MNSIILISYFIKDSIKSINIDLMTDGAKFAECSACKNAAAVDIKCTDCADSNLSTTGSEACVYSCSAGTAAKGNECNPCAAGNISAGGVACSDCKPGKFCATGNLTCIDKFLAS